MVSIDKREVGKVLNYHKRKVVQEKDVFKQLKSVQFFTQSASAIIGCCVCHSINNYTPQEYHPKMQIAHGVKVLFTRTGPYKILI